MTDLTFSVHPVELANAIFNAVELSKDAGGRPGCPNIMIEYGPDKAHEMGEVTVYGIGRIAGGRTVLTLDSGAPDTFVYVCIPREKAQTLQTMLRNQGGGKAARVSVRISEEGVETVDFDEDGEPEVGFHNLIISNAEGPFAELMESDPQDEWGRHLGLIALFLGKTKGPHEGPIAFSLEAMDRITALKGLGSKIVDISSTDRDQVVAVAVGPAFRGIIATIDRPLYEGEGFLLDG